jgi:uncharacterized small protein (DUF1192 family)
MKMIEIEWKDKAKNRGVLDQLTSVGLAVAELTDRIAGLQREIVTRKAAKAEAAVAAAAAAAAAAPAPGSTSPERRHRRKKKHSHLSVTTTASQQAPTSAAPARPSGKSSRVTEALSDSE